MAVLKKQAVRPLERPHAAKLGQNTWCPTTLVVLFAKTNVVTASQNNTASPSLKPFQTSNHSSSPSIGVAGHLDLDRLTPIPSWCRDSLGIVPPRIQRGSSYFKRWSCISLRKTLPIG